MENIKGSSASLPLVTVIVPVYNVRRFLRESLDSVIAQTYKNLEIIIIDDGSTDGSEKICDMYLKKDDRIRVIHQQNGGLSAARNTGLDAMKGEFAAFLDSDDALLPEMIETMVNGILGSGCDMAVCGYYVCNTTGYMEAAHSTGMFRLAGKTLSSRDALRYLAKGEINANVWNKLYSRRLFEHLRFAEGRVYEDRLIMPYLLETAHSVLLLDEPLMLYRIRSRSISATYSERNSLDWLYARKKMEKFVEERTPSVFSEKEKLMVLENDLDCLINSCFNLMLHRGKVSRRTRAIFAKELRRKKRYVPLFGRRTKVLYHLYCLDPYLCLFITKGYDHFKIFLSKLKTAAQRCIHE